MTLTAGQKAALTRATNRAGGSSPSGKASKAPASVIGEGRLSALTLTLTLEQRDGRLNVSFVPTREDTSEAYPTGLGTGERGLPDLQWVGVPRPDGEWDVTAASATLSQRSADYVSDLATLMVQSDRALETARADSEDPTFAFVVQQLATMFRASIVKVIATDGKHTLHKRGTAYLTTLRLCDTMTAGRKPVPQATPAPAPTVAPAPVKKAA